MELPSIPHSLRLFSKSAPRGWHYHLYRILSDIFQICRRGILSLVHRWHYHLYHILWLFPTLPPAGDISLLTVDTDGNFFTSSMLATLTPEREISPLNVSNGGIFSLHNGGNTDFSNLAPEGWGSRDLGSGGGNFILEESFTSPGLCLTHYYLHNK